MTLLYVSSLKILNDYIGSESYQNEVIYFIVYFIELPKIAKFYLGYLSLLLLVTVPKLNPTSC